MLASWNLHSSVWLNRLTETRNHQQVANIVFDIMWQEPFAEVHNRHTATIDQKLLKVPANVVRLQVVIRQTIFLFERHDRRWTVSLQVQSIYNREVGQEA